MANTTKTILGYPTSSGFAFSYNAVVEGSTHVTDALKPLDDAFGIFGNGQVNNKGKITIAGFKGKPLMGQSNADCGTAAQGTTMSAYQSEVDPCPMLINEVYCPKDSGSDVIDAVYLYQAAGASPKPEETAAFRAVMESFLSIFNENLSATFMTILTAGGLFTGSETFAAGVSAADQAAFTRMIDICDGWLKRYITASNLTITQANAGIVLANFATVGGVAGSGAFTADPITLYSNILAQAGSELVKYASGMAIIGAGKKRPVLHVSARIYAAFENKYNALKQSAALNFGGRITKEALIINGVNMGDYLMIDKTLIVPHFEVNNLDSLLTGKMEFAYLSVTQNAHLWHSLKKRPVQSNFAPSGMFDASIVVLDGNVTDNIGQRKYQGEALLATVVADTTLVAGMATYIVAP